MKRIANTPASAGGATAPHLEALWMPFTHNRLFKREPRLVVEASGMHYTTADGRRILDGMSGLWCCNAGHRHPKIVDAVMRQLSRLDYAPPFQTMHDKGFELATALAELAPDDLDHVFFTNSGSEAVDTALKIALAYHHARGEGGRFRFIGRAKAYHGVGFGGISVGGISNNRRVYAAALLPGVDHLPHTHDLAHTAYTHGMPTWGAHLAEELERIVQLHDAATIAAVIVEPMQGSAGVIVPPIGYLERLRAICDRHGILLVFDEVITGFGRLGHYFGAERFGVTPDIITFAKGVNSGVIPLGGALVRRNVYDACMQGPEHVIELFHGYTYSAHPLACAAGLAALEVYREEGLMARARSLERCLEDAVHALRGEPHVIDIRNLGLAAAIELESRPGDAGKRAMEIFHYCFDHGVMLRYTGDIIALGPAPIAQPADIERIVDLVRAALRDVA